MPSIPPSVESLGAPVCARQAQIYSKGNAREFFVERDSDADATRTGFGEPGARGATCAGKLAAS